MRIDKARGCEFSISSFQIEINKLFKEGYSQKEAQEFIDACEVGFLSTPEIRDKIKVFVEPSHLGRGYVGTFLCPNCYKRVKSIFYLQSKYGCRFCFHLTYKKADRRKCIINKLVFNNEARKRFMSSGRLKYMKMAFEAQWAREALLSSGYDFGKEKVS